MGFLRTTSLDANISPIELEINRIMSPRKKRSTGSLKVLLKDQREPWNLAKTYTLVEKVFGPEQRAIVHPCLRSVVDRQNFARYHYHESNRLLATFQRRYLQNGLLLALHGEDDGAREPFERLMIASGAHVTACIQAIHAIPDILASGIYFGYGMNLSVHALLDRNVNLKNVTTVARKIPGGDKFADLLARISSGTLYAHLSALSNLSKHRTVIRAALSEDQTGNRGKLHELHVAAFEKLTEKGVKRFAEVPLADLLAPEYDRLGELVVEIGHQLNNALEQKASELK